MSKRRQAARNAVKRKKTGLWREKLGNLLSHAWLGRLVAITCVISTVVWLQGRIDIENIFPIEKVQIEGEFRYLSKQSLQTQALPYVRGGFFTVNLDDVRNAVIELPWVEDVSIRRYWPNELIIRVIEKQAVAYWGDKALVSSRAELFVPEVIDENMQLPRISGPDGQHKNMLEEMARMQSWLQDANFTIAHLKQDTRRSWVIRMESGLELRLGRKNYNERLQRFVNAYEQGLNKEISKIKHVDMRYTNGLAVAWKEA